MWIAREKDGHLFLILNKPFIECERYDFSEDDYWWSTGDSDDDGYELPDNLFPEVTFENSPMEVDLVIKNK